MSRHNQVTARLLVELLEMMYRDPQLGPIYTASLAQASHSGTLVARWTGDNGFAHSESARFDVTA